MSSFVWLIEVSLIGGAICKCYKTVLSTHLQYIISINQNLVILYGFVAHIIGTYFSPPLDSVTSFSFSTGTVA